MTCNAHRPPARSPRRVNIRAVLADPTQRRELFVAGIIAIQAREGIETTREQAERAYDEYQRRNP